MVRTNKPRVDVETVVTYYGEDDRRWRLRIDRDTEMVTLGQLNPEDIIIGGICMPLDAYLALSAPVSRVSR